MLDEPTSELEEATRDLVVAVLRVHVARGALLLIATHDQAVAAQMEQRLVLRPVGTGQQPARDATPRVRHAVPPR